MVSKTSDWANWRATSLPIPELAPVTSAQALGDAGMPHYGSEERQSRPTVWPDCAVSYGVAAGRVRTRTATARAVSVIGSRPASA